MNKKRKIYVGALLLAVSVFVYDRLTFDPEATGPARATAALQARDGEAQNPSKPGLAAETGEDDSATDAALGPGIAGRIDAVWEDQRVDLASLRDVLRPGGAWQQAVETATVKPAGMERLEALQRSYTLTGVVSGKNGTAILGDRVVKVGQTIDGCRLVEVTGQGAVFRAGEAEIVLRVPR